MQFIQTRQFILNCSCNIEKKLIKWKILRFALRWWDLWEMDLTRKDSLYMISVNNHRLCFIKSIYNREKQRSNLYLLCLTKEILHSTINYYNETDDQRELIHLTWHWKYNIIYCLIFTIITLSNSYDQHTIQKWFEKNK